MINFSTFLTLYMFSLGYTLQNHLIFLLQQQYSEVSENSEEHTCDLARGTRPRQAELQ